MSALGGPVKELLRKVTRGEAFTRCVRVIQPPEGTRIINFIHTRELFYLANEVPKLAAFEVMHAVVDLAEVGTEVLV